MTSITFPLTPGDNNDNVANLKAALDTLLDKQQLGLGGEDSANFPVFPAFVGVLHQQSEKQTTLKK